jgi:hypothetical protein
MNALYFTGTVPSTYFTENVLTFFGNKTKRKIYRYQTVESTVSAGIILQQTELLPSERCWNLVVMAAPSSMKLGFIL